MEEAEEQKEEEKEEEREEENEYEYIDFGPEVKGKLEISREKKDDQVRVNRDYEVVEDNGPQKQGNTWQQRVARLFRWVPQLPRIPWRTAQKTQHREKSLSQPSHIVTRSELSSCKDKSNGTRSELSSSKDKSYVTRSELSISKDKSCVTRSEPSSSKDKSCVTRSELSSCKDKSHVTRSKLKQNEDKLCLTNSDKKRTNIQDMTKSVTDGQGELQVCLKSPAPPLTTHQTRVLQSLDKINIPSWFRPVTKPTRQRHGQHTDKPQWKRSQEQSPNPAARSSDEPTSHWPSSRETSACPSFSSAYSRLSSTRQAYRSGRDRSIQSWQAPITHSYKEPYIGWRSHQPHQESVPYLLPPPQRLANSTARDAGARANL